MTSMDEGVWDEAADQDEEDFPPSAIEEEAADTDDVAWGRAGTEGAEEAVTADQQGQGKTDPGQAGSRELTPEEATERINALLVSMNDQRRTLLHILGLCREKTAVSAVNEAIAGWTKNNVSVYSPTKLCELLQEAGGLRHVNEDGTDFVPQTAAERAGEREQEPAGEGEPAGAETPREAPAASDAPAGESPAPGADADTNSPDGPGTDQGGVTLSAVTTPPETYWLSTPEGVAAADADNPRDRLAKLLQDDEYYLPVYKDILELLADEPRTKAQVDVVVKASPLTQSPKRLSGYFLERLERGEAIEWANPWQITDLGRELLEDEALYR